MNYGVLVLGASITISLFLRICGVSGEVNVSHSDYWTSERDARLQLYQQMELSDPVYTWATGNKLHDFEQTVRNIWLEPYQGTKATRQYLDQMESYIADLRQTIVQPRRSEAEIRELQKRNLNMDLDYDEICDMDLNYSSDDEVAMESQARNSPDSYPEGCIYEDIRDALICGDRSLGEMPKLPVQTELKEFWLSYTKIESISRDAFGDRTIKNIVLTNNRLQHVDKYSFSKVQNLTELIIINNEIQRISRRIYAGLPMTRLIRLDNNLISFRIYESCPEKPIEDIPCMLPNLNYFSLNGNPLGIIPKQMFAGLRESPVNLLSLSGCQLESIHEDTFIYLPRLKNLILSENPKLMRTLLKTFEGLRNTNLTKLDLSANNLLDVHREVLEIVAHSLEDLDLNSNFFSFISINTFPAYLPKLRTLNLSNCRITMIENGSLAGMLSLTELNLDNNKLKVVPPDVSNLINLNVLYFGGSGFPTFDIAPNTFEKLSKLKILFMKSLPLTYISPETFQGLTGLMYMTMEDIEIDAIHDCAFFEMKELRILSMIGCFRPNTSINALTFFGLEKLETLHLQRNNICIPPPPSSKQNDSSLDFLKCNKSNSAVDRKARDFSSPFKFLPRLEYLALDDNKMESLFPKFFEGLNSLKNLSLDRNGVQSWQDSIFPNGTNLQFLSLSKNNIGPITEAMHEDFLQIECDGIECGLDLSWNSFLCDRLTCRVRNFAEEGNITLIDWDIKSHYQCVDVETQTYYKIREIPEHLCQSKVIEPGEIGDNIDVDTSPYSLAITVGIVAICGILIVAGLVTGYKNRIHLKYFWFSTKFNIQNKINSVLVETFSYDMFVSFHQDETKFVRDYLLPEMEGTATENNNDTEITEENSNDSTVFKVCLHLRDFEVGVPITENILDCVDRSKSVIVLVSKKYLESQWCVFEMNLAYHRLVESRRKTFVVVFMEDIPNEMKPKVLNYLIKSRTYLEWPGFESSSQDQKIFWNRLKTSLLSRN